MSVHCARIDFATRGSDGGLRGGMVPDIRRCRAGDFPAVIRLFRQHWPADDVRERALRDAFERGLASPRQRYLCAEIDARVVGFGSLTLKNSLRQDGLVGHVDELVVDRDYRCRGISTVLLQRIEELAVTVGCSRLELDCDFHHKEAHAFYQQRRFERRALLLSKQLG